MSYFSSRIDPKPLEYIWDCVKQFGRECYKTWRQELFAAGVIAVMTYAIEANSREPLALAHFETAGVATLMTLGAFGGWHLLRTPWLVHRHTAISQRVDEHWRFGVFGILVIAGMLSGGTAFVRSLWQARMPLTTFSIPSPPPPPKVEIIVGGATPATTSDGGRGATSGVDVGAQAERRKIQDKCAEYVAAAKQIEQGWIARLGKSEEEQKQSALAAEKWHNDVEHYLGIIPRGNIYVAKFATPVSAGNGYPIGMNMDYAGYWQRLLGDMKTLTDIMSDPDLGKP